jgi:tetrahydromethanopterin S-methyltransferase subunit G
MSSVGPTPPARVHTAKRSASAIDPTCGMFGASAPGFLAPPASTRRPRQPETAHGKALVFGVAGLNAMIREDCEVAPMDGKPDTPPASDEKVSPSWLILQRLDDLKEQIAEISHRLDRLEQRFDDHAAAVERRFEAIDRRFENIDRRFENIDRRFDAVDRRFEAIDRRFAALEQRWTWALGLLFVMALGLLAKLLVPGA